MTRPIPVLWLCGPAGVGKSTVSWQLFTELTQSGIPAAFVDTDQLCMCYPAPVGDPGRERIKAHNLDAVIANYQAAGARCLIVNGVVDPVAGVLRELLPHAALTVCRLRADRDETARRFAERHGPSSDLSELIADTLAEVDGLDASDFADACVDTTDVPASKVAARVRQSCPDWPGFLASASRRSAASAYPPADPDSGASDGLAGNIVLICGPTGVGKSTIGFELYLGTLRRGLTAGYVDLDQLAFIHPGASNDPVHHQLKARNRGHLADLPRCGRQACRCDRPNTGRGRLAVLRQRAARRDHHTVPTPCWASRTDAADPVPRRRRQLAAAGRPAARPA
jgi:adenylylsulfate kinase-like enzyme